ncbi:MAG: polyketide synthase, partial [Alteromonadaceae bacterium]
MNSRDKIFGWVVNWLQRYLNVSQDKISENSVFYELGLDSVGAVVLVGELEEDFDCVLEETLIWDYPTIKTLVDYLENLGIKNRILEEVE